MEDSDSRIRSQNTKSIYHELLVYLAPLCSIYFISLFYPTYQRPGAQVSALVKSLSLVCGDQVKTCSPTSPEVTQIARRQFLSDTPWTQVLSSLGPGCG